MDWLLDWHYRNNPPQVNGGYLDCYLLLPPPPSVVGFESCNYIALIACRLRLTTITFVIDKPTDRIANYRSDKNSSLSLSERDECRLITHKVQRCTCKSSTSWPSSLDHSSLGLYTGTWKLRCCCRCNRFINEPFSSISTKAAFNPRSGIHLVFLVCDNNNGLNDEGEAQNQPTNQVDKHKNPIDTVCWILWFLSVTLPFVIVHHFPQRLVSFSFLSSKHSIFCCFR